MKSNNELHTSYLDDKLLQRGDGGRQPSVRVYKGRKPSLTKEQVTEVRRRAKAGERKNRVGA
jgi:hypothetical protein